MIIFDLVHFIAFLREIIRDLSSGSPKEESYFVHLPKTHQEWALKATRRILWFVAFGILASLVIMPTCGALYAYLTKSITPYDATMRGILLVAFFPITFLIGIYFGLALGYVTSPKWYRHTELGSRWKRVIGTESLGAAYIVSMIVIIVGLAIYGFFIWMTPDMGSFTR